MITQDERDLRILQLPDHLLLLALVEAVIQNEKLTKRHYDQNSSLMSTMLWSLTEQKHNFWSKQFNKYSR